MQYQDPLNNTISPYPDHNIDPSKKGMEWCVAYAKAAWTDFSYGVPKGVFANNQGDYERNRMYALGKQPVSSYKKSLGIDEQADNTWMSIDWSVRPIVSGYRDRVISRMMKQNYQIVATPVDMLAKSELSEKYAKMKAKLILRDLAKQEGNEELMNHPLLMAQPDDPYDVEELEMRVQFGEQLNRSKDAEIAIALGFYENKYEFWRKLVYEDLFDFGVAGYKEWLGTDNKAHFRRVNPENVVVSYCRDPFFRDLVHAGELIDVSLVDLATFTDENGNTLFTEEDLLKFASSIAGRFGNPGTMQRNFVGLKGYDKFKCRVLDLEFYSYDRHTYRNVSDEVGNVDFRKAENYRKSEKYTKKTYKMVYKCKWVVGTDRAYDFGPCYDQKRSNIPEKKAETSLSYKFVASHFYEMKAQSMMQNLIPYLDDYQLTCYKVQNFKNRSVPSGWWIDLDAMENVALNKGGAPMQPKELLQMFMETGVLVGRSMKADGSPMGPNWKPVIPIENTAASELAMFFQDMVNTLMAIEKMTGFNDISMGNPNPKTLVPGYEMANESTNDALYPLANAEAALSEQLAYDVLKRMQQGIKKGGISGYGYALNNNILTFMTVNPDIAFREYGIMLQKKSTEQERIWLMQMMQGDIQNGFLDASDAVTLIHTHNAKQAQMLWASRVKKAKELMQQREMQKIQLNNEGAKEAAMIAQQATMQQKQMEYQFEMQKLQMQLQAQMQMKQMEIEAQMAVSYQTNATKLEIADADNSGKVGSSAVQGNAKVQSQILANQGMIEKQKIANEKPTATPKKK